MEMIKQSNSRNFYYNTFKSAILACLICIFYILFFVIFNQKAVGLFVLVIVLFFLSIMLSIKENLYNITKIEYENKTLYLEYYCINTLKELSGNISDFNIDIKQTLLSKTKNYKLMIKYKNTNTLIEQYTNAIFDENYWTCELIEEIHDKLNELKDEAIKLNKLNNKQ